MKHAALTSILGGRGMTNTLEEVLTALADALAKRPAEEVTTQGLRK